MPLSHNQKAFHAGEWSPNLYARVDLQKYHSGAALLQNFFVDYRGGASNRPGTKYILQAYKSATAVRLIPFAASFTVSYVLEFGDGYIRFYNNGAAVLETAGAITGATQGNPCQITQVGHGYSTGDWVFIQGVVGMTQLNGKYYQITNTGANTYTLQDLNGVNINSTGYTAYSSAGTGARVYTLTSPYAAADLALIKFAQNVNSLILCHNAYPAYVLTLSTATSWTLTAITYGTTVQAPASLSSVTTLAAGNIDYTYVVTAVDANGQESNASAQRSEPNRVDNVTNPQTTTLSWNASAGAIYYNVYEAMRTTGTPPTDPFFGYIGSTYSISFADTSIVPDFSSTPPIAQQPFLGGALSSITVTAPGVYTVVPTVTIAAPPSGIQATALAALGIQTTGAISGATTGWVVGDIAVISTGTSAGSRLVVASVDGSGRVTAVQPLTYPGSNRGSLGSGSVLGNPVFFIKLGDPGAIRFQINLTWGVVSVILATVGAGYTSAPAITFSGGAAAATAVVGPVGQSFPSVPAFFDQRLALASTVQAPQTIWFSKPGSYYNYDISHPTQPDDSITATIVSSQLNEIKAMVPAPAGLLILTSRQAWQINGGASGAPVSAVDTSAQAHAFNGASDVPPILANYDILYVQSKGSIVRDLSYDFYKNIYTGTDVSVLSNHLFFKYQIEEWAFAEEPFKVVWAVRSDGQLLSLTFLKEQEVIGWAHSITTGLFKSVCTVTENTSFGAVDAVYFVVERTINGHTVKYIERMAERFLTSDAAPDQNCWFVDAGLQYIGAPATVFSGLDHLEGQFVVGLADGFIISGTVTGGQITISTPASVVTIGLPYACILQTLILDLGEPTVIGRLKKIVAVTVRAADTIAIEFGRTLSTMVPMKDFSGSVNAQGVTIPFALETIDARQIIDPITDQNGQYYIRQLGPVPVTILGVVPEIKVEDRK